MRVRIPCLPLDKSRRLRFGLVAKCPDGERDIISRFERDVAGSTPARGAERWWLWCSGFCTAGCEPEGEGSIPSSDPCIRSVLLGEQAISKVAAQGSNPCAPADCRRGSIQKGAAPVMRTMLVRIQSSALDRAACGLALVHA